VTIGVLLGLLAGKPLGTFVTSLAVTRLSSGRLRPPVGWAAVISAGTSTGVGFTVSLLVACLAFTGAGLDDAKLGILGAAALAPALTWMVIRATRLLPRPRRINALLGGAAPLVDLANDVDPTRDHIRGPLDAPVTVVETATSSARTAGALNPRSASCCATSLTCATSGGTCRSPTCTRTPSSRPRQQRRPRRRTRSGPCTTSCSLIRTHWRPRTSSAMPGGSAWTWSGSPATSRCVSGPSASPPTSRART
jgi:hypothetical protein